MENEDALNNYEEESTRDYDDPLDEKDDIKEDSGIGIAKRFKDLNIADLNNGQKSKVEKIINSYVYNHAYLMDSKADLYNYLMGELIKGFNKYDPSISKPQTWASKILKNRIKNLIKKKYPKTKLGKERKNCRIKEMKSFGALIDDDTEGDPNDVLGTEDNLYSDEYWAENQYPNFDKIKEIAKKTLTSEEYDIIIKLNPLLSDSKENLNQYTEEEVAKIYGKSQSDISRIKDKIYKILRLKYA